jgi:hypothetical protein
LPPIYAEFLRTILHVVDFVHATSLNLREYDTDFEDMDMDFSEDEDSTDSGFHPEGEEEDDEP